MKISREALEEVKRALDEYTTAVATAGLQPNTVTTYLLHSTNFVRWIEDDFVPGGRLKRS